MREKSRRASEGREAAEKKASRVLKETRSGLGMRSKKEGARSEWRGSRASAERSAL